MNRTGALSVNTKRQENYFLDTKEQSAHSDSSKAHIEGKIFKRPFNTDNLAFFITDLNLDVVLFLCLFVCLFVLIEHVKSKMLRLS